MAAKKASLIEIFCLNVSTSAAWEISRQRALNFIEFKLNPRKINLIVLIDVQMSLFFAQCMQTVTVSTGQL